MQSFGFGNRGGKECEHVDRRSDSLLHLCVYSRSKLTHQHPPEPLPPVRDERKNVPKAQESSLAFHGCAAQQSFHTTKQWKSHAGKYVKYILKQEHDNRRGGAEIHNVEVAKPHKVLTRVWKLYAEAYRHESGGRKVRAGLETVTWSCRWIQVWQVETYRGFAQRRVEWRSWDPKTTTSGKSNKPLDVFPIQFCSLYRLLTLLFIFNHRNWGRKKKKRIRLTSGDFIYNSLLDAKYLAAVMSETVEICSSALVRLIIYLHF